MGHLGLLKARLAKLRRELITPKGGGGGPGEGFDVAKTGDARIGFVGEWNNFMCMYVTQVIKYIYKRNWVSLVILRKCLWKCVLIKKKYHFKVWSLVVKLSSKNL